MAGQKQGIHDIEQYEDDVTCSWRRCGMEGSYSAFHSPTRPFSTLPQSPVLPAHLLSRYMVPSRSIYLHTPFFPLFPLLLFFTAPSPFPYTCPLHPRTRTRSFVSVGDVFASIAVDCPVLRRIRLLPSWSSNSGLRSLGPHHVSHPFVTDVTTIVFISCLNCTSSFFFYDTHCILFLHCDADLTVPVLHSSFYFVLYT
ncbi:hypothetical protein C8R42DRAFT_339906 [Lentinula raphanica]|nr:hypothetical protein C8R42DRAFT_339906 [Lentinula raphanica]